jgi:hypothetical protein
MLKLDVNGTLYNAEMHITNLIKDAAETDPDWERTLEEHLDADGFRRGAGGAWIINTPRLIKIKLDGSEYAKDKNDKEEAQSLGALHYVCSVLKAE